MIRQAEQSDIPRLLDLLTQVDLVHHSIRPDLFRGPAQKYTESDLLLILKDDSRPIFVYDADGLLLGYAFCILQQYIGHPIMTDVKTLYIDDLCVDETARNQQIGSLLFDHVRTYAAENGCYNITLNVWEGNDAAKRFYVHLGMHVQKTGMEMIL